MKLNKYNKLIVSSLACTLIAINFNGASFTNASNQFTKVDQQSLTSLDNEHSLVEKTLEPAETLLLNSSFQVLQKGMRHANVKTLKANLKKLGFPVPGKGTTLYGADTERQVKAVQAYYGLAVTGKVDAVTNNKINSNANSPLQKGKRHKNTQTLKQDLAIIGYPVPGNGTRLYGADTERIVKKFQGNHNLVANGIADDVTLAKIASLKKSSPNANVLQNGMRDARVKTLKANLKKLGFPVPGKGTTLYGADTERQVRALQAYYGLAVTGKVDSATDSKITSNANSPLQNGKRHKNTVKLKADLGKIGYRVPGNGTRLYGSDTEKVVRKFQQDNRLIVNGIADDVTLERIAFLVKEAEKPVIKTEYTNYNLSLDEAVTIQLARNPQTDKYKNNPAFVHKDYLEIGIITGRNVNIRTEPDRSAEVAFKLKKDSPLNIVNVVEGGIFQDTNIWYEIVANGEKYYVHSNYADNKKATVVNASTGLNVRADKNTSSHVYGKLNNGAVVGLRNSSGTWYEIDYKGWRLPTRADLKNSMNPNVGNKIQHLRLDSLAGAKASQLNVSLNGKGSLHNQGQAFIKGAKAAKINEAYLVAHAILETGHGKSKLAQGIEVGLNKNNRPTVVTDKNRDSLTDIKMTYNMFGIGAIDSDPNNAGAIRAYSEGWFSPEKAIEGGAKWVGEQYIYNEHRQNTLYKMRWNPRMYAGFAWKQYATDIDWVNKQINRMNEIYKAIDSPNEHYDIATYR